MTRNNERMIQETLRIFAEGKPIVEMEDTMGERHFEIDGVLVHIKGDSEKPDGSYLFNINTNMYGVDANILVCNRADVFYTLPNSIIAELDYHPESYHERYGEQRTIIHVKVGMQTVGSGSSAKIDASQYYRVKINQWNQEYRQLAK